MTESAVSTTLKGSDPTGCKGLKQHRLVATSPIDPISWHLDFNFIIVFSSVIVMFAKKIFIEKINLHPFGNEKNLCSVDNFEQCTHGWTADLSNE